MVPAFAETRPAVSARHACRDRRSAHGEQRRASGVLVGRDSRSIARRDDDVLDRGIRRADAPGPRARVDRRTGPVTRSREGASSSRRPARPFGLAGRPVSVTPTPPPSSSR